MRQTTADLELCAILGPISSNVHTLRLHVSKYGPAFTTQIHQSCRPSLCQPRASNKPHHLSRLGISPIITSGMAPWRMAARFVTERSWSPGARRGSTGKKCRRNASEFHQFSRFRSIDPFSGFVMLMLLKKHKYRLESHPLLNIYEV